MTHVMVPAGLLKASNLACAAATPRPPRTTPHTTVATTMSSGRQRRWKDPRMPGKSSQSQSDGRHPRGMALRSARHQGANTPCVMKSVLSPVVSPSPSGPPSYTFTAASCQTDRAPPTTRPGISELTVVEIEQAAPIVVSAVAEHGTEGPNPVSWTVAAPCPVGLGAGLL